MITIAKDYTLPLAKNDDYVYLSSDKTNELQFKFGMRFLFYKMTASEIDFSDIDRGILRVKLNGFYSNENVNRYKKGDAVFFNFFDLESVDSPVPVILDGVERVDSDDYIFYIDTQKLKTESFWFYNLLLSKGLYRTFSSIQKVLTKKTAPNSEGYGIFSVNDIMRNLVGFDLFDENKEDFSIEFDLLPFEEYLVKNTYTEKSQFTNTTSKISYSDAEVIPFSKGDYVICELDYPLNSSQERFSFYQGSQRVVDIIKNPSSGRVDVVLDKPAIYGSLSVQGSIFRADFESSELTDMSLLQEGKICVYSGLKDSELVGMSEDDLTQRLDSLRNKGFYMSYSPRNQKTSIQDEGYLTKRGEGSTEYEVTDSEGLIHRYSFFDSSIDLNGLVKTPSNPKTINDAVDSGEMIPYLTADRGLPVVRECDKSYRLKTKTSVNTFLINGGFDDLSGWESNPVDGVSFIEEADFLGVEETVVFQNIGAEEGKFYRVKADGLNSELIVNGDFDTDSDWIKLGNVSIDNGVASFVDDGTNSNSFIKQFILSPSKTYKLTFDVTRYVNGDLQIIIEGGNTFNIDLNGIGSYELTFDSLNATGGFTIKRNGATPNYDFDIDNISVKRNEGFVDLKVGNQQEWIPFTGDSVIMAKPEFGGNLYFKSLSGYIDNVSVKEVKVNKEFLPESVINGSFDSDSDWALDDGWSISGGQLIGIQTPNVSKGVRQSFPNSSPNSLFLKENTLYRVNVQLSGYQSGEVAVGLNKSSNSTPYFSGDGLHSFEVTSGDYISQGAILFIFDNLGEFVGNIDSVSVQEIQSLSPLGDELVVNGDFSDGLNDWSNFDGALALNIGGCKITRTNGFARLIQSGGYIKQNTTYKVSYEILENNGCTFFEFYAGSGYELIEHTVGVHEFTFTRIDTIPNIYFYNTTDNSDITIDNISVKEVLIPEIDLVPVVDEDGVPVYDFTDESEELVTNGAFDNQTGWILYNNWNIYGGKARWNWINGGATALRQIGKSFVKDKKYRIYFDVSDLDDSGYNSAFGFYGNSSAERLFDFGTDSFGVNENLSGGSYYFEATALVDASELRVYAFKNTVSSLSFSIDNLYIEEVSPDEFTFNMKNPKRFERVRLLFPDMLGSMNGFNFDLFSAKKVKTSKDTYVKDRNDFSSFNTIKYNSKSRGKTDLLTTKSFELTLNSDFLTQEESNYFEDLISSNDVYAQYKGDVIAVNIDSQSVIIKERESGLIRYSLKVQYSQKEGQW